MKTYILYPVKRFIKKHSSLILTSASIIGFISTVVSASTATLKAQEKLKNLNDNESAFKSIFPLYIPTLFVGAGTIACIAGLAVTTSGKEAALIGAYAMTNQKLRTYQNKIETACGPDEAIEEQKKNIQENFQKQSESLDVSETLFYDEYSGRFFTSTLDNVKFAAYNLNKSLSVRGFADLNEWYDLVGLEPLSYGYQIGWARNSDCTWIDFYFHLINIDEGLDAWVIEMSHLPDGTFRS